LFFTFHIPCFATNDRILSLLEKVKLTVLVPMATAGRDKIMKNDFLKQIHYLKLQRYNFLCIHGALFDEIFFNHAFQKQIAFFLLFSEFWLSLRIQFKKNYN